MIYNLLMFYPNILSKMKNIFSGTQVENVRF